MTRCENAVENIHNLFIYLMYLVMYLLRESQILTNHGQQFGSERVNKFSSHHQT